MKTQKYLILNTSTKRVFEVIEPANNKKGFVVYWEQYQVKSRYSNPGEFTLHNVVKNINKRLIFA